LILWQVILDTHRTNGAELQAQQISEGAKFRDIKQNPEESVEEYSIRFKRQVELASSIGSILTETGLRGALLDGLVDKERNQTFLTTVWTNHANLVSLDAFIQYAIRCEQNNLLSKVKQVRTETEATTTRREVNAQNQSTLQTERLVAMNQLIGNGVYGGIICFKCRRAGEPYDRVISHETKNCTHHQNGTNDSFWNNWMEHWLRVPGITNLIAIVIIESLGNFVVKYSFYLGNIALLKLESTQ